MSHYEPLDGHQVAEVKRASDLVVRIAAGADGLEARMTVWPKRKMGQDMLPGSELAMGTPIVSNYSKDRFVSATWVVPVDFTPTTQSVLALLRAGDSVSPVLTIQGSTGVVLRSKGVAVDDLDFQVWRKNKAGREVLVGTFRVGSSTTTTGTLRNVTVEEKVTA